MDGEGVLDLALDFLPSCVVGALLVDQAAGRRPMMQACSASPQYLRARPEHWPGAALTRRRPTPERR
jgi:DNA-binding transcriptional LysR family regulator